MRPPGLPIAHTDGATAAARGEATLRGVGKTARIVNDAAVIMIAVFISFGTADVSIVRQLGIGPAVTIALDAWVIRLLVMPAALLIGRERIWPTPGIRRSSRAKSNRAI